MHNLIEPVRFKIYLATLLKWGRGLMCYYESNIDCLKLGASDLNKFDTDNGKHFTDWTPFRFH